MPQIGEASVKQAFAMHLWQLADLVHAADRRSSFRARAYKRAVWSLDKLSPDLDDPVDDIMAVPGIGAGIASLIEEFRRTGRLAELEGLRSLYPSDARRIARLPRMTPGRQQFLKAELGIDRIDELLEAIEDGKAAGVPGVGEVTARLWQKILADRPSFSARPIEEASAFAQTLAQHALANLRGVEPRIGGQIARFEDWIEVIELNVSLIDLERASRFLGQSAVVTKVIATDPLEVGTLAGVPVRLNTAPAEMPRAPGVITASHLQGDLHLHTTWSGDGHLQSEELIHQARLRGYSYLAITDHTIGLRMGGLDSNALARQRGELVGLQSPGIWVMQGAELNIDRAGNLDLDEETLAGLDFAIAAVHSFFSLDRDEQTARIIRAIEHPAVRVIAHLTGRRIGIRPPIDVDLEPILEAAARTGTALEVNGHLDRLDLSAEMVAVARAYGVWFAANSDAHRLHELENVHNSIGVLGRAQVEPGQVVNTWPLEQFLEWIGPSAEAGRSFR
jgi:histidinol phosphatase-like PHP family hydrolase/DNA polymerase/3'-5' exonuclease PolX